MRSLTVVFLFFFAASASASIGPFAGVGAGLAAVGKSFATLGAALVPAGLLFPLAVVAPLKAFVGFKAIKLLKLKLLAAKAPIVAPVAAGVSGKLALGHAAAHIAHAKVALLQAPLKLKAMKLGVIQNVLHGAHSVNPKFILASDILNQEPEAQPQPEVPSYGQKKPAYAPAPAYAAPRAPAPAYAPSRAAAPAYAPPAHAAPAYGPTSATQYRKRREANEKQHQPTNTEIVIAEVFDFITRNDTDHCVRRSLCAIAVQPDLAKGYAPTTLASFDDLIDDPTAPWHPYKHAVAVGEERKSHESCALEFPLCKKNVEEIIAHAIRQLESSS